MVFPFHDRQSIKHRQLRRIAQSGQNQQDRLSRVKKKTKKEYNINYETSGRSTTLSVWLIYCWYKSASSYTQSLERCCNLHSISFIPTYPTSHNNQLVIREDSCIAKISWCCHLAYGFPRITRWTVHVNSGDEFAI